MGAVQRNITAVQLKVQLILTLTKIGNMSGQWKQDTFGCFSNVGTCCFGYCCGPCLVKRNADDLGKPGFLYCLLSCCIPCVPIFILRQEAREKYGIEGSTGEDALCSFFCASCTNCQTAVEIEGRGDHS